MTAEVKPPEESKKESNWTKVGVVAGVVGAAAAVLVFILPQPIRDVFNLDPRIQTPSANTTQNSTSAPSNPPGTNQPNERHLAGLPLTQGGGVVKVVDGRDLSMPCGSGQSDDRYREIEYELPGPYTSFITQASAGGRADAEASVGVQIFIRARQDRSDRTLEAGSIRVPANGSETLAADITNARAILLRITCSTSTLTVTFTDPRIGR